MSVVFMLVSFAQQFVVQVDDAGVATDPKIAAGER
jgi:hypothetical protein